LDGFLFCDRLGVKIMWNSKKLQLLILILAISFVTAISQPNPPKIIDSKIPPPMAATEKGVYYCYKGNFSVEIPTPYYNPNAFPLSLQSTKGLGTGETYSWLADGATYHIQYIDLKDVSTNNLAQIVKNSVTNISANQNLKNGKLISEKDFSVSQITGKELKFKFSDKIEKYRLFLIGKRLFVFQIEIKKPEKESEVSPFLESFNQIDSKLLIERKIAEAEPKPLPQTPVVKKVKFDAEDLRLKGKVMSLAQENEYLSDSQRSFYIGKRREFENYYNEKGDLVRTASYGIDNSQTSITVYGYSGGKRVSLVSRISYQNSEKKGNASEMLNLENIYDGKGQLVEEILGDFKSVLKSVYSYVGNTVEKISFYENNKIGNKSITSLDEKGNEIEVVFVNESNSKSPYIKHRFKYDSFDEYGNWTKRTQTSEINGVNSVTKYTLAQYRTIKYFY
jgi:hypothetical protein